MGHHHQPLHLPSFGKKEASTPSAMPKGCVAVKVGHEGEEQHRFVVPVTYVNHPLFAGLLKEAEEEHGFHHKGAITIPCHVDYFRSVQGMIEKSRRVAPHHHHHHLHLNCFGGLKA